jgi:hypothetical protein
MEKPFTYVSLDGHKETVAVAEAGKRGVGGMGAALSLAASGLWFGADAARSRLIS